MVAVVSNNTGSGRKQKRHKFPEGNTFGRGGNPFASKIHKLKAALYRATTDAQIERIAKKLLGLAEDGDVAAAKEMFDRLFGKANQPIDVSGEMKVNHELRLFMAAAADPDAVRHLDALADRLAGVAGEPGPSPN